MAPKDNEKKTSAGVKVLTALGKVAKAFLVPSVQTYFLLSGILYAGNGALIFFSRVTIDSFFCNIDPREVAGGIGCTKCPSEILVCKQADCYRHAMNITYRLTASKNTMVNYQQFMTAAQDTQCNEMVLKSASPVKMIQNIAANNSVSQGCKRFHCAVLKYALLQSPDLNTRTGVCTNKDNSKPASLASTCVCASLMTGNDILNNKASIQSLCGSWIVDDFCPTFGSTVPNWCPPTPAPTPAPTASSATTSVTARLLAADNAAGKHGMSTTSGVPQVWTDLVEKKKVISIKGADAQESCHDGKTTSAVPMATPFAPQTAAPRRLQNTPAPQGAANDQFPDYTVSDWTRCTCYLQCIAGVKTRLVTCGASTCKAPKPKTSEVCKCSHCADCQADLNLMIVMYCYFAQGGVAIAVFVSFLHMGSFDMDDLVKLSILTRLIGLFCKNLPICVRILVIANFFQLTIIIVQAWVPSSVLAWEKDCKSSNALGYTSLITFGVWSIQLILGRVAKTMTRQPPYMFTPYRNKLPPPLKQLKMLIRSLGP